MTNALKGAIGFAANAIMLAIAAFGVGITEKQIAAVGLALNGILAVWMLLTYKASPKRIPDDG